MSEVIQIQPDEPAVIAARLVRRLQRDKLLDGPERRSPSACRLHADAVTEALADEIHQDILDRMCGGGGR